MKLICDYCGKETRKTPSNIKRWKKHFCNNECRINYRKENNIAKKSHSMKYQKKLENMASIYKNKKCDRK